MALSRRVRSLELALIALAVVALLIDRRLRRLEISPAARPAEWSRREGWRSVDRAIELAAI